MMITDSSESKFYRVGDLVDGQDITHGAWFEGEIVRIVKNPQTSNLKPEEDDGLLYLVKFKM